MTEEILESIADNLFFQGFDHRFHGLEREDKMKVLEIIGALWRSAA